LGLPHGMLWNESQNAEKMNEHEESRLIMSINEKYSNKRELHRNESLCITQ